MTLYLSRDILGLQFVGDFDIQVSSVLFIGSILQNTRNVLLTHNSQHVLKVENSLFPVSVLGVGSGGELDRLVTSRELDIEPCNQSVNEVAAASCKLKIHAECKVCRLYSV